MKNEFFAKGKNLTLFVDAPPDTDYSCLAVSLDLKDLDTIRSWPGTWYAFIHQRTGQVYIRATAHRVNGKAVSVPGFTQKQPLLHRVISKPDRGENTVFKDGNTLNLTRDNLANVRIGETYIPKPKIGPEYADMVKGVHYRKDKQKYEVRCFYEGKAYNLGIHKDVEIANRRATDFRDHGPEGYLKKYGKWGTV